MDSRSLIFVMLAACAGPDPSIEHTTAAPSPLPGATRVSLDLVNRGGKGTVDIRIELRDGGRIIRADRTLEVEKKQTVHFETDIPAPPGAYTVSAASEFPD